MGRFSIFLGIILIFVAVGLMITVFTAEHIPFVEEMMVDLYCEEGETAISRASRLSFSGTQNSTEVYYCNDLDGNQREITGQVALTAVLVFFVPFAVGMVMIFYGVWHIKRNFRKLTMSSFGLDMDKVYSPKTLQSMSNGFTILANASTLTEHL